MKNLSILANKIESLIDSSEYQKAVELVANEFDIKINVKFKMNGKYFIGDKENRDIYEITLSTGERKYTFDFGQSIANSGFYACYGKSKLPIPREMIKNKKLDLIFYLRRHFKNDFSTVQNDSIKYPKEPNLYDVLACLQKYDVGTFEDFCGEFGYNQESKIAEKTYNLVIKEFEAMQRLFSNEELEVLSYIQ